jgi:hypothetical protein
VSASRDLAKAIHKTSERKVKRTRSNDQLGIVTRVKPLTVDPVGLGYVLHDDDIHLGQWVRAYKENTGLKKDDVLVLRRVSGQWVAVEVLSDTLRPLKIKKKAGGRKGTIDASSPQEEVQAEEETVEEEAEEKAEEIDKSQIKGFCKHDEDANKSRPEGFGSVEWLGVVEPVNAVDSDTLIVPPH